MHHRSRGLVCHPSAPAPRCQVTHAPDKTERRCGPPHRCPVPIAQGSSSKHALGRWDHRIGRLLRLAILVFVITGATSAVAADGSRKRAQSGSVAGSWERCAGACTAQDSSELFQRFCASCHGKSGKGDGSAAAYLDPRPADLTDADGVGQLSDEELLDVIGNGRRTMPAFSALLKPEELRAIAAFVRSLEGA